MAPEVLSESKYGRRGDIWAVGCTIIQMLTGEPPWKERKLNSLIQLHVVLSSWVGIPPLNRQIPDDLRNFLELCFARNPKDRPMAPTLLEHHFLSEE
jgi:serine/threonine protein kinase